MTEPADEETLERPPPPDPAEIIGAELLQRLSDAGLCVVPEEPTRKMCTFGWAHLDETLADRGSYPARAVYRRMLDAAGAI